MIAKTPAVAETATVASQTAATAARATCRFMTAKGNRCTGEALDPDPKVVQVCARHAAEVMELIADHKARRNRK